MYNSTQKIKHYALLRIRQGREKDFEKGVFISTPSRSPGIRRYRGAAKATLNRVRTINLRLSERDLQKMKARAAEKGIPYQTLAISVLHEYTSQ